MYLAPFSSDTIDEMAVVANIHSLFRTSIGQNLRRLVIDMPLRSVYPEDPGGPLVRPRLRHAFESLTNLQEFVSVKDELYLAVTEETRETPVWSSWKSLRRLSLYNVLLDKLRTEGHCQDVVECVVGGEAVTGSTRMKSGTATKLVRAAVMSRSQADEADTQHVLDRGYDQDRQDIWQFGAQAVITPDTS